MWHAWRERIHTKMLVINPERKKSLGKGRHRWEDNIKTYLK